MSEDQLEDDIKAHFSALVDDCERSEILTRRLAEGELEPQVLDREHIDDCPACRAVVEAFGHLSDDDGDWLDGAAASWPAATPRRRPIALALVAVAAVTLLWLFVPRSETPPEAPIAKGEWTLHVGMKRNGRTSRATLNTRFAVGDELGFFYTSPAPGYAAILVMDARGQAASVFPRVGFDAAPVPAGTEVRLDAGGTVTASEHAEWLVSGFSQSPFTVADLEGAIAIDPDTSDAAPTLRVRPDSPLTIQVMRLSR